MILRRLPMLAVTVAAAGAVVAVAGDTPAPDVRRVRHDAVRRGCRRCPPARR